MTPFAPGLVEGLARLPQIVQGRLPLAGQPLELGRLRGELFLAPADLAGELFSAGVQGMESRFVLADPRPELIAFGVGGCQLLAQPVAFGVGNSRVRSSCSNFSLSSPISCRAVRSSSSRRIKVSATSPREDSSDSRVST